MEKERAVIFGNGAEEFLVKHDYEKKKLNPIKGILGTGFGMQILPYLISTSYFENKRGPSEKLKKKLENTTYGILEDEVYTFGMSLGLVGVGTQIYLYSENPEFLAVPILTNLISGIYEFKKNKKLEDKINN